MISPRNTIPTCGRC